MVEVNECQYRVEMNNITKSFAGVKALQGVSFQLKPGEVHALMGENGAGKSTLIKILSGVLTPDSGEIKIEGKPIHICSPIDGIRNGISVIYQEFALVQHLSVTENIFLHELRESKGLLNWKNLRTRAKQFLKETGFENIDVNARVKDLSVAYQQVVEICKALTRNASVLVLDEPTAVLTNTEVKQLFVLIKKLRESGVAIIYISHRLEEVFSIADRITVLKDGQYVTTVDTRSITSGELVNLMIGRELGSYFPKRDAVIGETILEVRNVKSGLAVKDVSFNVRAGEVLGLAGLVGAGRSETIRAILGIDPLDAGEVYLNGKKVHFHSPKDALMHSVSLLPEDRKYQGVLLNRPIKHNITLSNLTRDYCGFAGWINNKKENKQVVKASGDVKLKCGSLNHNVSSLSGGNQQKVAIARLLTASSKVLILDEPTRGVDVGAKSEIFKLINDMVEHGSAVVMISSEMEEIIGMCDRAVVIRDGRNTGVLGKDELSEQNIIRFSMGVQSNAG